MIQFKRGRAAKWLALKKPLADGQPGYDKDRHKIKIGDGKTPWNLLPSASGLNKDEIFSSEKEAKSKKSKLASLLGTLFDLNSDGTVITYGDESPNDETVGEIYLQTYDAEIETDYVIDYGRSGIWTYRKWQSGLAECWTVLEQSTAIQTSYGSVGLFYNSKSLSRLDYPISFKETPVETVTLQSSGGVVWVASKGHNSETKTALYQLISPDKLASAKYWLSISIKGYWN